jgi:hypothetical protein
MITTLSDYITVQIKISRSHVVRYVYKETIWAGDWGVPIFKHIKNYFLIFNYKETIWAGDWGIPIFKHINKLFSHFQIAVKSNISNSTVVHTNYKNQYLRIFDI